MYVGITRARERLYLLRASTRQKRGRSGPVTPSRFLDEIPPELLEGENRADEAAVADACMAKLMALINQG
jgi:superfamily I DNA/RNA helicase